MVKNPPEGSQRVVPHVTYRDAPAAIAFLCNAFGFVERFRMSMQDGRIGHAELGLGDNLIMLSSPFEEFGLRSPLDLEGLHGQILCYVDDVDAHHAKAKEAGATVVGEPRDQDYGDRSYRAVDPEGHRWVFATHVRDVDPKDFGADA